MGQRRRRSKPLKRVTARRPERRTIVVFCEGKNSEPDYIRGVKRLPDIARNTALNIELYPERGLPLALVRRAVETASDPEVDECWCIFDVEWPQNHPHLQDAVSIANASGVKLAISNPCFELWLILHHKDYRGFALTCDAERISRDIDGRTGKSIDASIYMPLRSKAAQRAEALADRHRRDGTEFPHDNPSSGMYKLINALEPPIVS